MVEGCEVWRRIGVKEFIHPQMSRQNWLSKYNLLRSQVDGAGGLSACRELVHPGYWSTSSSTPQVDSVQFSPFQKWYQSWYPTLRSTVNISKVNTDIKKSWTFKAGRSKNKSWDDLLPHFIEKFFGFHCTETFYNLFDYNREMSLIAFNFILALFKPDMKHLIKGP